MNRKGSAPVIVALLLLAAGVAWSMWTAQRAAAEARALASRLSMAELASSTLSGLNDAVGTKLAEIQDRQARIDALAKEVAELRAEVNRLAARK